MAKLYTLQEAQAVLREQLAANLDEGEHCGTCLQWAKRYRRPLTSAMAYGLVILSREQLRERKEWLHVEQTLKNMPNIPSSIRGDVAKLKHWGLIEPAWGKRPDGSTRNGYYRVTDKGFDFIHGRISVPSHVLIYNGESQGLIGDLVNIRQALGKEFNYNEIMHDQQLPAEPQPPILAPPGQLFDTDPLTIKPVGQRH